MTLKTIVSIVALLAAPVALAQDASEAILQGLLPKRVATRSIALCPPTTRGIVVEGVAPETVLAAIKDQPTVSLRVLFAYDSARLTPEGIATLHTLGKALQNPRLCNAPLLIAGHTDARGSDEYNKRLSESRANAVREHLAQTFGIAPDRLSAIGFGRTKLADPARPEDGINRRVEVVNLTQ